MGNGQYKEEQERKPIEYAPDGYHTSRTIKPYKSSPRKRRTAEHAHKWTDPERRWVALAMFECNNCIEAAIEKIAEYQETYGRKNVCPLPSVKSMIGLTRGVNFDKYLENAVEGPIAGRLMSLTKSEDERVAADASKYLMDRAKGKATARVEVSSVSITLKEQSQKALNIIKQRDKIWKNSSGEESPG